MEWCILVNENDEIIGKEEKVSVHQTGNLHRAFSIFILNEKNEILLQKRALEKYHSPGLWTNTCCSHPRPGESVKEAAERRLMEEMGFTTDLKPVFSFIYKAEIGNDFIEHELDHVLIGRYANSFQFNPDEVAATRFVSMNQLRNEMEKQPESFTAWLQILMNEHFEKLQIAIKTCE